MDERSQALAARFAERLGAVAGVSALVVGGSRARGTARPDSDLDLGLYYEPAAPPDRAALQAVADALHTGRGPAHVTDFGEWGPWVNGGAWLETDGLRVDWLFRDLQRVTRTLDECRAGVVTCDYYLGHPHGFHNHYYLAELHHAVPLFDRGGDLARLKTRLDPYPPTLRQALVERYLYDAAFMLDTGRKHAESQDWLHLTGCLFRCAAALVQVLFALNERWLMNEKGAVAELPSMALAPPDAAARIEAALATPGRPAADELAALVRETRALCPPLAYAWELDEDA